MTWSDILQLVIIIVGWFAAFWFGINQQRINTKENAKLKVYEEFWRLRSSIHGAINQLSVHTQSGPPFILMESTAILGNVTRDQQHIWQGQQDALNYLNKYLNDLMFYQNDFTSKFLDFWRSLEMWLHVMPELETAVRVLASEYTLTSEKTSKLVSFLIALNRSDWKNWDRANLNEKCSAVWEDINNLAAYTEDMMGLIHNELVTPIFKYSKDYRKPLDPRYKVLTKTGLTVVKL